MRLRTTGLARGSRCASPGAACSSAFLICSFSLALSASAEMAVFFGSALRGSAIDLPTGVMQALCARPKAFGGMGLSRAARFSHIHATEVMSMLKLALTFLVIGLVAALLGFTEIAGVSIVIAKFFALLFGVL